MSRVDIAIIPLRQIIWWTLGVAAVIGCFWLLLRFNYIVPLLLTSLILSTALLPVVDWLESRGLKKSVAATGIFVILGLLAALLLWFTIPILTEQSSTIVQTLTDGYRLLYERLQGISNILIQRLIRSLPNEFVPPALEAGVAAIDSAENVPAVESQQGRLILNGVIQIVAIIMLTFFWTLEGNYIKQAMFLLFPLSKRENARNVVAEIESKIQSYLLGQGVLCLIIGFLAFLAYLGIGLPNALLLALFAGLLEAIPIIGPILGAIPAILIALALAPDKVIWVIVATIVIQQLENSFLVPRVMKRALGVRPLVSLLSLLAFSSLFGIMGALFALPLAAVVQLFMDRYLLGTENELIEQSGRTRYNVLHYETNELVQDIRNQARKKDEIPSVVSDALEDELEAIALDLSGWLAEQAEEAS